MKKLLLILCPLIMLSAACGKAEKISEQPASKPSFDYTYPLSVGGHVVAFEVVSTPEKMQQGLSGRESMAENQGMLFDFGENAKIIPSFWMKDMKFGLDFIWVYQNKIIGITADVPAPDVNCQPLIANCLPYYSPPSPVDMVMEVNAGWTKKNKIKVGDEIRW